MEVLIAAFFVYALGGIGPTPKTLEFMKKEHYQRYATVYPQSIIKGQDLWQEYIRYHAPNHILPTQNFPAWLTDMSHENGLRRLKDFYEWLYKKADLTKLQINLLPERVIDPTSSELINLYEQGIDQSFKEYRLSHPGEKIYNNIMNDDFKAFYFITLTLVAKNPVTVALENFVQLKMLESKYNAHDAMLKAYQAINIPTSAKILSDWLSHKAKPLEESQQSSASQEQQQCFDRLSGEVGEVIVTWEKIKEKYESNRSSRPSQEPIFPSLTGKLPKEIIEFQRMIANPDKYKGWGKAIQPPRGLLLYGPPGSGKTSIARALAQLLGAGFFNTTGGKFCYKYVGTGAALVEQFFNQGKNFIKQNQGKKAILFVDEIEALGNRSTMSEENSSGEYYKAINEFLAQMDGFEQNPDIIVVGATNYPERLDPAFVEGGRFMQVQVPLPDTDDRKAQLEFAIEHFVKQKDLPRSKFDSTINLTEIADLTNGFNGRHLFSIIQQAINQAAIEEEATSISQRHLLTQVKRIIKDTKDIKVRRDKTSPTTYETLEESNVTPREHPEVLHYMQKFNIPTSSQNIEMLDKLMMLFPRDQKNDLKNAFKICYELTRSTGTSSITPDHIEFIIHEIEKRKEKELKHMSYLSSQLQDKKESIKSFGNPQNI